MKKPAKLIGINDLYRIYGPQGTRKVKIAACSGSFDLLHAGHVSYLKEARGHGDVLVVFLNTDESIATYKGPGRPIATFSDRATLLDAFPFVDHIVPLSELNPLTLIEELKPEVFCNGADWGRFAAERSTVEAYGGTFTIVSAKTRALVSTSDLTMRAAHAAQSPSVRALFIEYSDIEAFHNHPTDFSTLQTLLKKNHWLLMVTIHDQPITKTKRVQIKNSLLKHNLLVTDVFSATSPLTNRDTTLFQQANQTFKLPLSKCWHLATGGSHGTSNARCANMKTARLGNAGSKQKNTLYRPDITLTSLRDLASPLGLKNNPNTKQL